MTVSVVPEMDEHFWIRFDSERSILIDRDQLVAVVEQGGRLLADEEHADRAIRRGLLAPELSEDELAKVRAFGLLADVSCVECGDGFEGTRLEARKARWEPFSTKTQAAIDSGPVVCPECLGRLLDGLLGAMRETQSSGRADS